MDRQDLSNASGEARTGGDGRPRAPEGDASEAGRSASGAPTEAAQPTGKARAAWSSKSAPASESEPPPTAQEYLHARRVEFTQVYITDNRRYDGVYVEGDLRARDVAGRDHRSSRSTGDGRSAAGRTRSVSVVRVARTELERLRRVVVDVGPREQAREVLERERLVLLQGAAGSGKGTAALNLLGLDQEILGLDPSLSLRQLAEVRGRLPDEVKPHYVVESLAPGTAAQLNSFTARAVSHDLAEQDGYLVVTVDDRVPVSPDLQPYLVHWRERPDPARALRTHLALSLIEEDLQSLESTSDYDQLQRCLAERPVRDIRSAADAVVKAVRQSRPLADLLDELGFGAQGRVADWFRPGRTAEDLGFLIAAAVLGGCAYLTVAQHGARLEELIAGRTRTKLSKRPLDPLRPRSERLREAMCVLEPGFVETDFGRTPADTVRLESAPLVRAVLDIVWHEYDLLAAALLDWLYEAGEDDDPGVRLRAALAAGYLAQYDFATVRERLLHPWALGTSQTSQAAADALGLAACLDATDALALALVDLWVDDPDYDLWWTGATALGGDAGLRDPSRALERLLDLVHRQDVRAPTVVADSAVRLVEAGGRFDAQVVAHVFTRLVRWLDQGTWPDFTARLTYARMLWLATDPDRPGSAEYRRLLVMQVHLEASARLLRATLAKKTFRSDALDALRLLVTAAERDEIPLALLDALLSRAANGPGSSALDRDRLVHYLTCWADEPGAGTAARRLAVHVNHPGPSTSSSFPGSARE